jgi:hypothetical protein
MWVRVMRESTVLVQRGEGVGMYERERLREGESACVLSSSLVVCLMKEMV